MKLKIAQLILTTVVVIIFGVAAPPAFGQQDTKGKPTVEGQINQSGKEAGKAGTTLGHEVKRGRVVRGGKRFGRHIGYAGRHIGYAGRHIGRGFKRVFTKAVRP